MTPAGLPAPALAFSLLGYPIRLADPAALRLLAVVAALAGLGAIALARRRRALARAAGSRPSVRVRCTPGVESDTIAVAMSWLSISASASSTDQDGTSRPPASVMPCDRSQLAYAGGTMC